MSSRSTDERSRAEARRRARLAARGELPDEEMDEEEAPPPPSGGVIGRFFPKAPPLPGRPDPLAGFDEAGPLRPIRVRAFLLRRNLLAWIGTGVIAFISYIASAFYGQSLLGLIGTFFLFGSLIAAGWFGWQRPTLFGTAAGLLGFLLASAFILFWFAQAGVAPEVFGSPADVISQLTIQGLYQAGLGFIGGWYGGYLRRRQTQLSADNRRRR